MEVEYFRTKKGGSPVEKFIKRQDIEVQAEIGAEIDRFKSLGDRFLWYFPKHVSKIKNDIMELKVKSQRKQYRLLFIFRDKKLYFFMHVLKKLKNLI